MKKMRLKNVVNHRLKNRWDISVNKRLTWVLVNAMRAFKVINRFLIYAMHFFYDFKLKLPNKINFVFDVIVVHQIS